jgi:hypothetical protein
MGSSNPLLTENYDLSSGSPYNLMYYGADGNTITSGSVSNTITSSLSTTLYGLGVVWV